MKPPETGRVFPMTPEDVEYVGSNLRKQDINEGYAYNGQHPLPLLRYSFETARQSYTLWYLDEEPVGLFGVCPGPNPGEGVPWMMATDKLRLVRRDFLRFGPTFIQHFHQEFPLLFNYVDVRNTVSVRWLKHMGFSFLRVVPMGPLGRPFYEFVRVR